MTSFETINLLHRLLKIISDKPNLDRLFSTGEAQAAQISRWVQELLNADDNNKAWTKINDLNRRLVNGIPADFKETGSRKIYAEAEQMLSELESLSSTYGEVTDHLGQLSNQIAVFINVYEGFLQQTSKRKYTCTNWNY